MIDYCDPSPDHVIMANLSAETVRDIIGSGSFHSVRVATNLCSLFYVAVDPESFSKALAINCSGNLFTCTIVGIKNRFILYVDESLRSQAVPF